MPNRLFDSTPNSASPSPITGAGVINTPQTALTFALLNSFAISAAPLGINTAT